MRKRAARYVTSLAIKFSGIGCLLLFYVVSARAVSAKDAGEFFLSFAVINVLTIVSMRGYGNALVKNTTLDGERRKLKASADFRLVRVTILRGALIILVATEVLSVVGSIYFDDSAGYLQIVSVMSLSLPFLTYAALTSSSLRAAGMPHIAMVILSVITPVIYVSILGVILLLGLSGNLLDAIHLGAIFVAAAFITAVYAHHIVETLIPFGECVNKEREQDARLRSFASSFFPIDVALNASRWIVQLCGGFFLVAPDLAALAIVQRVSAVASVPLMVGNYLFAPEFARFYGRADGRELVSDFRRVTALLILASIPLTLGLLLFGKSVLAVFGETYAADEWALGIVVLGQFFAVILGPIGIAFGMGGSDEGYRNISIVALSASLAASAALMWAFGYEGAVWALALSPVMQALVLHFGFRASRGIRLFV